MENRDLKMAEKIAACVADKGGRTFLVGGYVRDLLMGKHRNPWCTAKRAREYS